MVRQAFGPGSDRGLTLIILSLSKRHDEALSPMEREVRVSWKIFDLLFLPEKEPNYTEQRVFNYLFIYFTIFYNPRPTQVQ